MSVEFLEVRCMLHGGAGLSGSAAIEIPLSDAIHVEDHAGHSHGITIAEGESAMVIGPHHAEPGHSGSPYTHFLAETGDAHHFAWEDHDLSTPNVIDVFYDFGSSAEFVGAIWSEWFFGLGFFEVWQGKRMR